MSMAGDAAELAAAAHAEAKAKAQALTQKLYLRLVARQPAIVERGRYFAGEQGTLAASRHWSDMFKGMYRNFSDNWCEVVGRAAPERTRVLGFRVGTDRDVWSSTEKELWRVWQSNNCDAQSAQGFLSSAVTARSFALVWPDEEGDGEPLVRWEHSSRVIVDEDDLGRVRAALKTWRDDDGEHATLYTPDLVWKWTRTTADPNEPEKPVWEQRLPALTGDFEWPRTNPLGVVPVVEFGNRPLLGDGPISDIDGVMSMQDAVNLFWTYLFGAADHASLPARVVMGADPPKFPILDDKGQVVGEQVVDMKSLAERRLLWLTGENAKIGQWDAAKLDVFTDVINVQVKHMAARTRTPIDYIMGELGNVNGETLQATREPLTHKVREGQLHYTDPVRRLFALIALVQGNKALATECRTGRVSWANPETSTDAQTADAALKDSQIGWSFQSILERRYGLAPEEVADELAKRDKEATDPYVMAKLEGQQSDNSAAPEGGDEVPDEPAA